MGIRGRQLPPLGAEWIKRALAWNNLWGFPYLYGNTPATLDRLIERHPFTRIALYPDTLPRLADRQTKPWAWGEEYLLKALLRLVCRVERCCAGSPCTLAPWIDVYYRLGKKERNK